MGLIPTIYYCPYENCNASYKRKDRYETHARSHTGEKPFVCSHEGCGKAYTSSSHLRRHEDTHESCFRCTYEDCLKILKTKATLKKHIKIEHLKLKKEKVYACSQCGKEFNKHKTRQNHELKHSGQLPHKCSVEDCQKSFLQPSKLKRHMKIHEGYPCKVPQCDKVFGKWSLYVQHMKDSHRPDYTCKLCGKVFSTSSNLKSHALLHEESRAVYPCEVQNCSRYYYAKKNLNWHMKKYHAKRPFMCEKENCHQAFKTEAELADHILYHGKKKPRKKKKPKKPKPSLAALLSGVAEKRRVNRKSKQDKTEETDAIKNLSVDDLDLNQSLIKEKSNTCDSANENVSCTESSEASSIQNSFQSSQSDTSLNTSMATCDGASEYEEVEILCQDNILEADQSDFECSENHIVPMDCETSNSPIRLKSSKEVVQMCTNIEVVSSENQSQLISVPIIECDNKNWNKTVGVHIETVS